MGRLVLVFGCFAVIAGYCFAGSPSGTKGTASTRKTLPRFEDFSVKGGLENIASPPIDFSSHRSAKRYRTRLKAGYDKGPVFAGHFAIAEWGCGSACQVQMLVDTRTGKVYPTVAYTERGAAFRLNSRLFIADPPYPSDSFAYADDPASRLPVRYYILDGYTLRLVRTVPCTVIGRRHVCGGQ